MTNAVFTDKQTATRWQEIVETTAQAFTHANMEARELNALYDAAKRGRWIEAVFENGMYRYKTKAPNVPGGWQTWVVDYMPAPVASNPMLALGEAGPVIKITLTYENEDK